MKKRYKIALGLILVVLGGVLLTYFCTRDYDIQVALKELTELVEEDPRLSNFSVRIDTSLELTFRVKALDAMYRLFGMAPSLKNPSGRTAPLERVEVLFLESSTGACTPETFEYLKERIQSTKLYAHGVSVIIDFEIEEDVK